MGSDGCKLLLHLVKHYRHLQQDVVSAAELQMLVSSFLSPFYALKYRSGCHNSADKCHPTLQTSDELEKDSELGKNTTLPHA